jgi:pimeloyl-ACP methyl ester carboxylesterase
VNVYLFSGLGADERLFRSFSLGNNHKVIALPWIHPRTSQNLSDYAQLLSKTYNFEAPYALGGVSMGGMVAQELAAITQPQKLILISTVVSRDEFPALLKLAGALNLGSILQKPALEAIATIGDKFTIKSTEGRQLFYDMLKDSDKDFMHFGTKAILNWEAPRVDVPTIRIHGTKDRVFPISKVKKVDIIIDGGNHFMIFERSTEISRRLMNELEKNPVLRGMKPKI